MSLDKLYQLAGSLAKQIDDNQKLATPLLAVKLSRCVSQYPEDKTIGAVSRVIGDMTDHNTIFIRKADFRSLYHKMHTFGTKFAELFQEELGEVPAEPSTTLSQRDDSSTVNPYEAGDQVLANALESAFDSSIPLKMYSQPVANKAMRSVAATLEAWNIRPTQLAVGDGNERFIIVKADYETPKGLTCIYVPVEVTKDKVIDPEVFMGNLGPEDLNNTTIKAYVTQQAGVRSKIGATDILNAITVAATEKREISAAELALTRLNASRQGKNEFTGNTVLGLHIDAAAKADVATPKFDEFVSFEKEFTSPKGLANWKFGAENVSLARNHITRELASFGFTNPQVVVTGNDDNTIFYGVSLDTGKAAFTVPVKISGKQINKPTVLLCNGSITAFDKDGINQLVSENKSDVKTAAVASAMASLKPSEIINNLRQALATNNFPKAEDALNVLANSGDQKAHDTAFQIYMSALAGTKTEETKCSKMIKSAVSEYPICSHTGLPINKVYQDKDGNCRPLFRKGMDETYEGTTFINAKIFR